MCRFGAWLAAVPTVYVDALLHTLVVPTDDACDLVLRWLRVLR